VGGHAGLLGDGAWVYKPLQQGARGATELAFYQQVAAPVDARADNHAAAPRALLPAAFLPRFAGVVRASADSDAPDLLQLEDITRACVRPCVMDVKMGVQTWGEDASAAKIAAERAKCPSQAAVGLRVTGMRVWDPVLQRYFERSRSWGYGLDDSTLPAALGLFLADGGGGIRREAARALLARVSEIHAWFMEQARFRFYGSSLLLVYDGACADAERPVCDVRMIDFAHVWPIPRSQQPHGRDDGYVVGLESLMRYLKLATGED